MYRTSSRPVIGFHGCDLAVATDAISKQVPMQEKAETYHWLGQGVYFWENSPHRALEFAAMRSKLPGSTIKTPSMIGAVIDLGFCLDLTDLDCLNQLKMAYESYKADMALAGQPMPANTRPTGAGDNWHRQLDCSVIDYLNKMRRSDNLAEYDTVRAPFWEGHPVYPGTTFMAKTHVQIAVRNPNCIKGMFWVRESVPWSGDVTVAAAKAPSLTPKAKPV